MKTFFIFSLLFATHALVAQITQVINSNIRTELQFYEFSTAADNDDDTEDDPCVQLDISMSPSGFSYNEACVTWHCDAPCTHASDLYSYFYGISFYEQLNVLMLAYESNHLDEWCVNHSDDGFFWTGNASLANNGRITDSRDATWDEYNGAFVSPYLFGNSPYFNVKCRIAWRYEAGETINDPLQFVTLSPGVGVEYFGTNLPNPPGLYSGLDLGWHDDEGNPSPDVYFSFSLNEAAQVIISTDYTETDFDTYIVLYDANGDPSPINEDDDSGGPDGTSLLTANLNSGNYLVRVEGNADHYGQFKLGIKATTSIAPANDQSCAATDIPADGSVQSGFTNAYAGVAAGEDAIVPPIVACTNSWCDGNQINNSVWFRFVAPATGAVEVSTCGMADFDTQIAAYSVGNCNNYGSYTLVGASDDITGCDAYTSKMNVGGLTPGQTYYILVDGFLGETGNFSIQVTPIMASAAHEAVAGSPLLSAYPNPVSGLLTVRLDDPLTMQACTLSDLTGKTVAELRWTNPVNQTELDLGALPAGIYLLQASTSDRVFSEKIMVK